MLRAEGRGEGGGPLSCLYFRIAARSFTLHHQMHIRRSHVGKFFAFALLTTHLNSINPPACDLVGM
jgi:hypothetical protein